MPHLCLGGADVPQVRGGVHPLLGEAAAFPPPPAGHLGDPGRPHRAGGDAGTGCPPGAVGGVRRGGVHPHPPVRLPGRGRDGQRRRGGVRGPGGGAGAAAPLGDGGDSPLFRLAPGADLSGHHPGAVAAGPGVFPRGGGSIKPGRLARCGEGPRRVFWFSGGM